MVKFHRIILLLSFVLISSIFAGWAGLGPCATIFGEYLPEPPADYRWLDNARTTEGRLVGQTLSFDLRSKSISSSITLPERHKSYSSSDRGIPDPYSFVTGTLKSFNIDGIVATYELELSKGEHAKVSIYNSKNLEDLQNKRWIR